MESEKLEAAINKCGIEKVFKDLCEYICSEELVDFLGYFCDKEDYWPKMNKENIDKDFKIAISNLARVYHTTQDQIANEMQRFLNENKNF